MSKSELDRGLLQDKLITADGELLGQRAGDVSPLPMVDRENITPLARNVVENVVLEALSILDTSYEQGKPWTDVLEAKRSCSNQSFENCLTKVAKTSEMRVKPPFKEDPASPFTPALVQRSVIQVMTLQVREEASCDAIHAEEVAKIVKGLQDIQIGDSTYVLPADGSNLESQVKRAVYNINSLNFHDDMETAELIICDGQGDVDNEILEAEIGPPSNAKPQHDPAKVPTYFLHKMIEEMEDTDSGKGHPVDGGNEAGIAAWEENEEKLIRIIEGPSDEKIKDKTIVAEGAGELPMTDRIQVRECLESLLPVVENNLLGGNLDDLGTHEEDHPRDLLEPYTSKEPYWSSAGLIMRSVPQSHNQASKEASIIGDEVPILEDKPTSEDIPMDTVPNVSDGSVSNKTQPKSQKQKVKHTMKKSFGGKLRKFFSAFGRSKDC